MEEDKVKLRMQQIIDLVSSDISSMRTGKAAPAMVSELIVAAYGGQQKLKINELATISIQDAQTIVIDPWDKSIIGDIKKGIETANLNLNPIIDGEIIRIVIPPMTAEDREGMVKLLSTKLESAKIMVRQVRGDVMRDLKNKFENKEISEDEKFKSEKILQTITDTNISLIEDLGEKKKQELLQI